MSANPLLEKIRHLAEPLLASLGLEIWGMEFLPGGRAVLRIYIEKTASGEVTLPTAQTFVPQADEDRAGSDLTDESQAGEEQPAEAFPNGAGIDECAEASRLIGMTLEVEDIIPYAYVLEVSTPGLDRIFFTPAQFAAYAGQPVEIHLHASCPEYPDRKRFTGMVTQFASTDGVWRFAFAPISLEAITAGVTMTDDVPKIAFDWTGVKKARLLYIVPEKPGTPAKKKTGAAAKPNKKN